MYLAHNRISAISARSGGQFVNMTDLLWLDLTDNMIKTLEVWNLRGLNRLTNLWLNQNPFVSDYDDFLVTDFQLAGRVRGLIYLRIL